MPERKRIAWLGTASRDIAAFPVEAKLKLGTALRVAQEGGQHASGRLGEVIYVLHTFQKKAHQGTETPKRELDLIAKRLRLAKEIARRG